MSDARGQWIFAPRWWAWAASVLGGGLASWLLSGYPAVAWAQDPLHRSLLPAALIGLGWLAAQLCWLASDRSRGVFQWVFLGWWGCAALLPLIFAREAQIAHDIALNKEVEAARLVLRQQQVEQAKAAKEASVDRRERLREDRFVRYEGRVDPATLARMRAADAEILAAMEAAASTYEQTLEANPVRGPESWLRIATLDELETERSHHARAYEAARAYNDFLEGLETRYEAAVEALALEPPADRYAIAEMARLVQFWEYSGAREIRALDVKISGVALRALDLLREHWGEWYFDHANSRVVFEDGGTELAFIRLIEEARLLGREQARLRRQLEQAVQGAD